MALTQTQVKNDPLHLSIHEFCGKYELPFTLLTAVTKCVGYNLSPLILTTIVRYEYVIQNGK